MSHTIQPKERFNHLVAIRPFTSGKWLFRCDCGNEKVIEVYDVLRGSTSTCGCGLDRKPYIKSGTDAAKLTPLQAVAYRAWLTARRNASANKVELYYLWDQFERFLADVGEPATEDRRLLRRDTTKGYVPGNVHWST